MFRQLIVAVLILFSIILSPVDHASSTDLQAADIIETGKRVELRPQASSTLKLLYDEIVYNNTEKAPSGTLEYYEKLKIERYDRNFQLTDFFEIPGFYESIFIHDTSTSYVLVELRNQTQSSLALYHWNGTVLWNNPMDFGGDFFQLLGEHIYITSWKQHSQAVEYTIERYQPLNFSLVDTHSFVVDLQYNDLGTSDYYVNRMSFSSLHKYNETSLILNLGQGVKYYNDAHQSYMYKIINYNVPTQTLSVKSVPAQDCGDDAVEQDPDACAFHLDSRSGQVITLTQKFADSSNSQEQDLHYFILQYTEHETFTFEVSGEFHVVDTLARMNEDGSVSVVGIDISDDEFSYLYLEVSNNGDQALKDGTITLSNPAWMMLPVGPLSHIQIYSAGTGEGIDLEADLQIDPEPYTLPLSQPTSSVRGLDFRHTYIIGLLPVLLASRKKR